jgi:TonB family protein
MKAALFRLLFVALLSASVVGQVPNTSRHPGIALFQQGKFAEAIRSLEGAAKSGQHKGDPEIWSYLGLAYLAAGDNKKSRKALEKSVDLRPSDPVFRSNLAYAYLLDRQPRKAREQADKAIQLDPGNATAYQVLSTANLWEDKLDLAERNADTFISLDPKNPQAYVLKAHILLARFGARVQAGGEMRDEIGFLKTAVATLEAGITRTTGHPRSKDVEEELESISAFYRHFSKDRSSHAPSTPQPGVEPVKILTKPRARYTDLARTKGVEGTIRVAVLLGASGKVEHVMFITRLGSGLDNEVLRAVMGIQFEPKKVDGKPVSAVVTLEYTFDIY